MKKRFIFTALTAMVMLVCLSCQNDMDGDKQSNLIASNLSINGNNDPALLIGEWDLIKFAYTPDGNEIKDVQPISLYWPTTDIRKSISIFDTDINEWGDCRIEFDDVDFDDLTKISGHWYIGDQCPHYYVISENLMRHYTLVHCCTYKYIEYSEVELEIIEVLKNPYSFVIKDDELIIHFKGVKNKNLLFLKRKEL